MQKITRRASIGKLTRKERLKRVYLFLKNNTGRLVTTDEKAEVLNNFFALVFK